MLTLSLFRSLETIISKNLLKGFDLKWLRRRSKTGFNWIYLILIVKNVLNVNIVICNTETFFDLASHVELKM